MKRKSVFLTYTGLFFVVFFLGFLVFFLTGKSFVWKSDGYRQYYPALEYLGRYYRSIVSEVLHGSFQIPLVDYTVGQGEDILTTFANYGLGDPLTLLSALVPSRYTEYLYDVLVALRLYLSGIAFLIYCGEMKLRQKDSVYGALVYAFCGFAIWSFKDPFFLNALLYLPLILCGIERVVEKKRPLFLCVSVFLCVMSSYYFFYMIVIGALVYFAGRSYGRYGKFCKKTLTDGLSCLAAGVGGVLLAGVLIVPIACGYAGSSRTEAHTTLSSLFVYDLSYYKNMVTKFFMVTENNDAAAVGYASVAVIVFVALYVLVRKKDRASVLLRNGVIVCVLAIASPFVGFLMNGFVYVTNRFMFLPAFFLSVILVRMLPDLWELGKKEQRGLCLASAVYGGICLLLSGKEGWRPAVFMVLVLGATLAALCCITDRVWRRRAVCGLVCVNLIGNINLIYQGFGAGMADAYMDAGQVRRAYTSDRPVREAKKRMEEEGDRLARLDVMLHHGENPNQAVVASYPGISLYYSVINAGYCEYMMSLGNTADLMYSHRILGNDGRAVLENLAGTKYAACREQARVPYGFRPVDGVNGLYENTNETSIGYTYDRFVSEDDYDRADVFERQDTLSSSAVLAPGGHLYEKASTSGMAQGEIQSGAESLLFDMTDIKDLVWEDGKLKISGKNGSFRINFAMKPGRESYLRLTGMELARSEKSSLWGKVKMGKSSKSFLISDPRYDFYFGRDDYVIQLGSLPEGTADEVEKSLTCTLNGPAEYRIDNIELVEVPVDDLTQKMEKLCAESLRDTEVGKDGSITGKISVSAPKVLCLAVPYKKGYTLFVDGEETEICAVNKWYTGAWLEEGEHDILLEYASPGIAAGAAVSVFGVAVTIFITAFFRRRRT